MIISAHQGLLSRDALMFGFLDVISRDIRFLAPKKVLPA